MTRTIRTFICFLFVLFPGVAFAQTLGGGALLQGGPWAQGHSPMYVGQGSSQAIVMDSGPASGGGVGVGLSEQLLVARGTGTAPFIAQGSGPYGTNWCDYDAPTTNPTGYHFFCLSSNVGGNAYIVTGAGGTQPPQGLTFNINGILTTYTGAMPTVTSVGASFTGGLISVAGSPITTSGILAFTVAGNSGGVVYFTSPTTWASTPTLTVDLPLVGGGPGGAPSSAGKTGTTNVFASATGTFVDGDCLSVLNGDVIDAGGPCTTGGGGGTVSPGTINQLTWYAATGTTVSGLPTLANGTLVTSAGGVPSISLTLPTAVQGNITRTGTVATGVWAGTPVAGIHGGTGLTSFTAGGLIYAPTTTTLASSGSYTLNAPLFGGGPGAAPVAGTRSGNTTEVATVSGALVSGNCLKSDASGNAVDAATTCGGIIFSGTDGGTANARVVSSTGFSTATNNIVVFVATSTNTSTATANVNGTGAKNIFISTPSGPVALAGGEIVSGNTIALSYDGTQYQLVNPPNPSGIAMSSGLVMANNSGTPNTQIDVSASSVQMITTSGVATAKFSVSETINAATTGVNGLDTGSLAASTWYYVWEISNGSTTGGLLSLSSTAPTMPAGYAYKARLGAFLTDGSSHFLRIMQKGARAQYTPVAATNTPAYPTIGTVTGTYPVSPFMPPTATTLRAYVKNSSGSGRAALGVNSITNIIDIIVGSNGQTYGDLVLESTNVYLTIVGGQPANAVGWIDNVISN